MQRKWQMTPFNSAEVLGHFVGFVAQGCWKCCFLLRPQRHWHFLHFVSGFFSPRREDIKHPPLAEQAVLHKQLQVLLTEAVVAFCRVNDPSGTNGSLSPTKRSTGGPYGRFRLRTFNCTCVACMHCFRYFCHLWFSLHSCCSRHAWLNMSVELKKRH